MESPPTPSTLGVENGVSQTDSCQARVEVRLLHDSRDVRDGAHGRTAPLQTITHPAEPTRIPSAPTRKEHRRVSNRTHARAGHARLLVVGLVRLSHAGSAAVQMASHSGCRACFRGVEQAPRLRSLCLVAKTRRPCVLGRLWRRPCVRGVCFVWR